MAQQLIEKYPENAWEIVKGYDQQKFLSVRGAGSIVTCIRKYENDELVHDRITSAFFVNVHFAGQYAIDHANEIKSPLLVMHGMEDRLTSPTGSQDFASNSGDNVHLKMWNGLYHELHNEPEKQEIFNYEIEWMNKLLN